MDPEQWPRLELIFHNALRIPLIQRDSFLHSECGDDQCLYAELISLLSSHEADSLLDRGAANLAAGWLLATTHEPRAGNRIGPYEISGEIGRGGMGAVYRARDTRLERDVALKFVWDTGIGSSERFPHFDREVRAASALNHPNIITIHDVGSAGGVPYIACEFVDGMTLRERLARGPMELDEVLHVGLQVAEALGVAHGAGIVHRDIKPENIMIRRDGLVKVVDFGVATLSTAGPAAGAACMSGTPRYMAPEQVRGAPAVAQSDVYSVGLVLYEMATGRGPSFAMTLVPLASDLREVVSRSVAADPVERYPSGSEMKAALEKIASGRRHRQRNLPNRLWLALGALAILTAGLFAFLFSRPAAAPSYYSAVPLMSEAGAQLCSSFAPDGERVAFSWDGEKEDNFDIYVKQIGGGTPLRLTSDLRPDMSPAWSPDGRSIAFMRFSPDNTGEVLLISSAARGSERQLAKVTAPYPDYRNLKLLAWSPNGRWLVVLDVRGIQAGSGLSLLSMETGEKRKLTVPPAGYDDLEPAFSPDGTRLAFVRRASRFAGDVYMVEMSKAMQVRGEPKRLTFDHRPNGSPVWMPNGQALLFTRYDLPGRPSLWKMTLSNPPRLEPVPISADNASALALSPRGDRLLYASQMNNANLWAVDLPVAGSSRRGIAIPRPWSASSQEDLTPSFSPDGRQVAFQSTRSGWDEIWVADRDGSHPHQLIELRGSVAGFPHWSPDGKKIVFHSRQQSYARLFLLDLSAGRPTPLSYQAIDDYQPSWSHDGKWIYFGSLRSGEHEVWKVSAEGGPIMQVTRHGGWVPLESRDGQYLFYTKPDSGVWRMPLPAGEEQPVFSEAVSAIGSAYAPGRKGIYFVRQGTPASKQSLMFFRFKDGQTTTLTEISRPLELGFALSPDERTILYSQIDHVSSELMLVEHFH